MVGIDISGVQPPDVPGPWEFIVVKSTENLSVVNPLVTQQWANAARTTRGLYHYARPGLSSATAQAQVFCADALARGFKPGVDLWQLDAEDGENGGLGAGEWHGFIVEFMDFTLARLGSRGFLYAGYYFVTGHGIQDLVQKYKWWLPDYGPNDGTVHPIEPGVDTNEVVIHQYSSFGGLDRNQILDPVRYGQAPAPTPAPKGKKVEPFFYRVTDNPAVSPNSIWLSDGIVFTRHIGSPTTLADWQWVLAVNGVPNTTKIGTLPYAAHAELHQF